MLRGLDPRERHRRENKGSVDEAVSKMEEVLSIGEEQARQQHSMLLELRRIRERIERSPDPLLGVDFHEPRR